jgi:hypothetical protein
MLWSTGHKSILIFGIYFLYLRLVYVLTGAFTISIPSSGPSAEQAHLLSHQIDHKNMSTQKADFPSKSDEYYIQQLTLLGLITPNTRDKTRHELIQEFRRKDEREAGYHTGDDMNIDDIPPSDESDSEDGF